MSLVSFFETLKNKEIKLNLDDRGNIRVIGRRDRFDPALLAEMKEKKDVIVEWLKEETMMLRPQIMPQPRKTNELPTSFAQQRLWFIDQLGGGSPQYNIPSVLRIQGPFNEDIAERVLRRIIERHEPLRTVFRDGEDGPLQHIRQTFDFQLQRIDLSSLTREEQEQRAREAANADAAKPFDLSADLMLRAAFVRLSEDEGVLLFNVHHIASDGWSMNVLVSEFNALYEAFSKGEPDPLRPLAVQYADYAQWQREWLAGEVLERQLSYWERQLAELPQVHGLPLDRPRPVVQTFNGAMHQFTLDHATVTALKQLALAEQATVFMVLQGVFALLLARHSNSEDVVIGTPVANRLQKELAPLVGFFVNTLVLRTDCRAGRTFREYLRQVKGLNLNAQANQDVPFEYLVERLKPQRTTSHAPLFQIMFNMNASEGGAGVLRELELTPLRSERVVVKFDLMLDALEDTDELWLSFTYNIDLFEERTIARLGEHFQNLARSVAANADERIELLPLLSESEQRHLLYELNETAAEYPRAPLLQELFEAQVERHPESVALVYADRQLSYRELNKQANQLAHYLREQGVGADVLVGLCVERSLAMVVGMLGILKAGGAYVPLDPSYPPEQLHYLIKGSAPALVLTQASLESVLSSEVRKLRLDAERELFSAYPTDNPQPRAAGLTANNLAYVIYTSGSTGRPKGVMIEHASVVNLALSLIQHVVVDTNKAWAWVASYAFDASVKGLAQLMTGRPLLIVGEEEKHDPRALVALLERHRPGVIDCTPSLLELWLSMGLEANLPDLVIGGEAIAPALWQQLVQWQQQYGRRALNVYGPTECSVDTTVTVIAGETPHIGRPLANVRCYVLGAGQSLAPQGSAGELYIGGDGLARGYHDRPELTAENFIPDPFSEKPGARLYRTGDAVRYRSDGQIEFLGRLDNQVKVRGYRIELGEIEAALQQHEAVREALVLVREDGRGDKRLVAYVSPQAERQNPEELNQPEFIGGLRQRLQAQLPHYMMPAQFVIMEHWPLTTNGKIDRKKLPAPDDAALIDEYVAASTQTEGILQTIWQEVLAIPRLGVTTNFFEAGGHSLLAIQLISKTNQQFGQLLQLQNIFERQTIREMAAHLDSYKNSTATKNVQPQPNIIQVKVAKAEVRPLFLVHPVGGYAHCYYELARNLDYQGPVYGFQVDDTIPGTIDGMAAKYIQVLKGIQPNGAYLLGGWSMGGVVAYEMAQQLKRGNDSIDPLLMVDSFCPNIVPEFSATMSTADEIALLQTLAAELGISDQGLSSVERDALGQMSLEKLMAVFIRLGREQNLLPVEFDLRKRYATVLKNTRAVRVYEVLPLDVEIQLIRAQQNRNPDWTLGWGSLARKVTVRELPGDHFSLIRQPDVFELGKVINKILSTHGAQRQLAHVF